MTDQQMAAERNDRSQKKQEQISRITLIGSDATVKLNIAKAGPNVIRAQPQNSGNVIVWVNEGCILVVIIHDCKGLIGD